jgi:gliding motility-associated-like protein
LPDFVIKGDALICSGKASSLFIDPANPDWNVLWYPPEGLNDPTSLTPLLTIDSTRYYTALITDENGCQSLRDITIRVEQLPLISRIPLQDTSIFIGESIELSIESDNPAALYSWGPDYRISCMTCNQPIVTPEDNVVYNVTVSDECFTITEQFPVEVIIDFYIETPDAFSPNGDNNNDIFMPETKNIREIKEFKIFNRWGNLVFETTRLDEGWDGTVNGKIQHMDTYAFYIRAVSSHGYETEKRGNFILMK